MSETKQLPAHITEVSGTVTYSGGWYVHEHYHSHPEDDRSINHAKSSKHRHEHCWEPQERHHHLVNA